MTIADEVLQRHGLTPDEYRRIVEALEREPTLTELGIFSVMWSEHCSYKLQELEGSPQDAAHDRKTGASGAR